MIAVVALIASGYTGLQWTEAEMSQNELDSQSLRVDFEAPTRSALGPWEKGHLFTGDSIGVPLQLAPEWRVTASFQQKSSEQKGGEWKAKVTLREKGSGGRDWWSQSHDLEPKVEGDRAHLDVNMSHWVAEAQQMAGEASVPGDLEIEIAIQHSTMVMTREGERATSRTARILVELRDELVIAQTHDDTASFHEDVPKGPPWIGIGAAGLALFAGGFALYARGRHPKHPVEGAIMVESLVVPDDAVETDSEGISHLARHTRQSPLVRRAQQRAPAHGGHALCGPAGHTEGSGGQVQGYGWRTMIRTPINGLFSTGHRSILQRVVELPLRARATSSGPRVALRTCNVHARS